MEKRWTAYARLAEEGGADVILNACSSIGELVQPAQQHVSIPIVRIDEAMAEKAVQQGDNIGVAATLATTLNPTMRLIREKGRQIGKTVALKPQLADQAYELLMAGDQEGHDRLLARELKKLAVDVDVVVLAQASMARNGNVPRGRAESLSVQSGIGHGTGQTFARKEVTP